MWDLNEGSICSHATTQQLARNAGLGSLGPVTPSASDHRLLHHTGDKQQTVIRKERHFNYHRADRKHVQLCEGNKTHS